MGTIGRRHVEALGHLEGDVRLVAASGGAASTLAELGQADAVHVSPDEVIAHPDVDVVVLCTPSGLHGEQTLTALRAGKHVVVEKPLSVDVASAEEAVRVAEERGLFVSVISQRRLEPQSQYVKRLVDEGTLGRPVLGEAFVHWLRDDAYYAHAAWRTRQDQGGGSLMNQGLHSVDLLAWLMGPVTQVTAQYDTLGHDMDAEDTTVATLRFASGALGTVVTSTATPPGRPATMKLFTSRGAAEFANSDVVSWDFDGVPAPPEPNAAPGSGASDPSAIGLAGHLAQWRDIVDAYRSGRPPAIGARDGLATVRLLCGIYEAAETGRAVTLDQPDVPVAAQTLERSP
ncbi:Gfo/Idh/MocA family oxidoreductase [Phytoactinopolyspora halotolerans]|uniref:Gfo/Idh/MocA family oxidoreductase n=2 Tax=Phytoactinopolyspora halotolerans TaxID=1981512 RepID=A0A6L9SAQ7_9ACTN|nr:Gfo/Idh/MocA family oxidoreductase [Phytoactinopolyspora halotolerans]